MKKLMKKTKRNSKKNKSFEKRGEEIEQQGINWDDYIAILREHSSSDWFHIGWTSHIKKVNPYLIKKNIIPLDEVAVHDLILSKILSYVAYADGKIDKKEKKYLAELGLKMAEKKPSKISQSKMDNFDDTLKQIYVFYHLINIALIDSELSNKEIDLICSLSEFLGITNKILSILSIYRDNYENHEMSKKLFLDYDKNRNEIVKSVNSIEKKFHTDSDNGNLQFDERRNEILKVVESLKQKKIDQSICSQLESIALQVGNGRLRIGIVGITSSGKTALMNALLGENLLPESVAPTTNLEVLVRRSKHRRATILFFNEPSQTWQGQTLAEMLNKATNEEFNPGNQMDIESIELEHPNFLLPETLEMVDTPGLNALGHEDHAEVTMKQVLPQLDMIIYLTTVTNALKKPDMDFIKIANTRMTDDQKLLFVITCKGKEKDSPDTPRVQKWNQQIQRLRKDLDEQGFPDNRASISLVDNLWGQWGRIGYLQAWKDSGFEEMLNKLAVYAKNLRDDWFCLQSGKAFDLLNDKVLSPLKIRMSKDSTKQDENKKILENKLKEINAAKRLMDQYFEEMKNRYNKISQTRITVKEPYDAGEFKDSINNIKTTCNNSLNDILKVLDEKSKNAIKELKQININANARRECVRKPNLLDAPESVKEKRYRRAPGAWNWLKSLVGQEDLESYMVFDSEKSLKALNAYHIKSKQEIKNFSQLCLTEFERKYNKPILEEANNCKSAKKALGQPENKEDIKFSQYLEDIVVSWKNDLETQLKSKNKTKQQKDKAIKSKGKIGNQSFFQHHHIPTALEENKISGKKLILFGGQMHQEIKWIEEAIGLKIKDSKEYDKPKWLGCPPENFPEDYQQLKTEMHFNQEYSILIYPETTENVQIPEQMLDFIENNDDWHLGIHVDVNRLGSGLSDIQAAIGGDFNYLTKLKNKKKIFFWNIDMGHFDTSDRLFELITIVSEKFESKPLKDIPLLFSETGDLRWTYLMKFGKSWKKYPGLSSFFGRAWSHNEYSTVAPFFPAVIAELDNRFSQYLNLR